MPPSPGFIISRFLFKWETCDSSFHLDAIVELLAGLILIVLHSGNREAPEEGEKWQNGWPMEQSE